MRVLFDQGVPVPLRGFLPDHVVQTAFELGWAELKNGELLARAERQFDVLVTTDRNLRFQQNLSGLRMAILVLPTTSWPRLQALTDRIVAAVASARPGTYTEVGV